MTRRVLGVTVLVSAVAAGAVATFPGRIALILSLWILALLACGLGALLAGARKLSRGSPSRFEQAVAARHEKAGRPEDLRRSERVCGWRIYEARDFDFHVRPLLKELIAFRLEERTGTLDDATPDDPELRQLAGPRSAEEIYDRAMTTADLERIIGRIEAL